MSNNNWITNLVKAIVIGLICALIIAILDKLGVFPFVLNNKWVMAIAGFVTLMVLILTWIISKICKTGNEDIKKIRIISGVFSLILIVGIIGIITFIPPNGNNVRVPSFIGMEIVEAAYEAYYAGLELDPIRVEGYEVTFQDPQEGSLVTKNSTVKVIIGKPTIEITNPLDNSSANSYCYVTGNSFGVASNHPNLKIYVLIYSFSTSGYQVQKAPPPQSNGGWQARCILENLSGERFWIYAIITTQKIEEQQLDAFPISVAMASPITITRLQ